MKTLFPPLILFIFISLTGVGQKLDLPYNRFTGEITQTNVVDIGKSKELAFKNIKGWLSQKYSNYWEIIKSEDPARGKIVFQGSESIYSRGFKAFTYMVTIDIKDGKYSCIIDQVKTLRAEAKEFVSADMNFSTIYTYQKWIEDIEVAKKMKKSKAELAKLDRERRSKELYLAELFQAHDAMSFHFSKVQTEIKNVVLKGESVATR